MVGVPSGFAQLVPWPARPTAGVDSLSWPMHRPGMKVPPTCPRCAQPVRAPDLWSSAWRCDRHGEVLPFHLGRPISPDGLSAVVQGSKAPFWVPHPIMPGWVVTGFGYCGDDRVGTRATVLCCSGPAPLGGPGDMVLVAEEPGVGLGARHAGLAQPDPGHGFDVGAPHAKVIAADHPTAMWSVPGADDRAVFVGEAKGLWLWAVVWPELAGVLMYDGVTLVDLRDGDVEIAHGSPSPRLSGPPASAA